MHSAPDASHELLIFGCWARYKSYKCEQSEEIPLFSPQLLALMELCHIRACFACKADMYKVCNCPARSFTLAPAPRSYALA